MLNSAQIGVTWKKLSFSAQPEQSKRPYTKSMDIKKRVIGITGSLASGKTTAAMEFAALGAVKIDADAIAHEILKNDKEVKENIEKAFGPGVMNSGKVDREKLAEVVFSDGGKLRNLCRITHPAIIAAIRRAVIEASGDVVVIDAPLLFESGLAEEVDTVVVVAAGRDICLKRAVSRGMPEERARKILDIQIPIEKKIRMADHVIINDGENEKIKEGVKLAWQKK
jgi:dephospho-CoA kinase